MASLPGSLTPLQRLFKLLRSERSEIRNIYIFAIFSGLIALSLPLGIQAILTFLTAGELSTAWAMLVTFVVLGVVLSGILQVRQMTITERIEQRLFARASFDFAYRIPRINQESVHNRYLPEVVNRFFEIMTIQKGLSKILIDLTSSAIQIVFGIFLLSLYHPLFILLGGGLVGILYVLFRFTGPLGLKTSLEESKYKFEVAHWLEEIGRTMHTFKMIGTSDLPLGKTDKLVEGYLGARQKHFRVLIWQFSGMIGFKAFVAAGLLILGSILVVSRQINLGQFVASEIIILLVLSSVEKLILSVSTIYDVLTALEKLGNVMDLPMEKDSGVSLQETPGGDGLQLHVTDLSFTFPDAREPFLKNLNFHIRSGERILVTGPNGSGKTTLLKVIAGIYSEYKGIIAYNDFPLGNLRVESLRSIIGYDLTETDVFKGTVYENIQAGRPGISLEDVKRAAAMVRLDEVIRTWPTGYETHITPEGLRLSTGVRAKIILARAIAVSPKVLMLEDTLAALPYDERLGIYQEILQPSHGWTVILCSNDLGISRMVDKIMVLNEGMLVEMNSYDDLNNKWMAFGTSR
ncbi:MAG: peptidase domain-containing ABC transporter [Flavobacteriales bacterium]